MNTKELAFGNYVSIDNSPKNFIVCITDIVTKDKKY